MGSEMCIRDRYIALVPLYVKTNPISRSQLLSLSSDYSDQSFPFGSSIVNPSNVVNVADMADEEKLDIDDILELTV